MEKLTFVKRTDSDQQGNALISKQGKPYTRVSIKIESKGDRYISGFGSKENEAWKVGDEVEISITESSSKDKNGQPYLNFTVPKKEDRTLENTELILNRLVGISLKLDQILAHIVPQTKAKAQVNDYPENNVDEPFPDDF